MQAAGHSSSAPLFEFLTLHSLTWLVAANAVGNWLAILLVWPELGDLVAPLSYGRWMPVHLNLQLYGWCSLPLVGLLLRWYLPRRVSLELPLLAVAVWSGSLLFAAIGWLTGHSSGKIFLEWTGPSRWVFSLNLVFLCLALFVLFLGQTRERRAENRSRKFPLLFGLKAVILLGLAFIPVVLFRAADPTTYPSINPDSGGATGGSLLGSTLSIVLIFWATPLTLGLKTRTGRRACIITLGLLLAHFVLFAALDHGNRSHHESAQIAALASLFLWIPLLVWHLRSFAWPAASGRWLRAFLVWGCLLVSTAFLTFLPGVLEGWKFTNALVSHSHLAMAGMLSSFLVLVLIALNGSTRLAALFNRASSYWMWQAGTLIYVLSMMALGTLEAMDPGILFRGASMVKLLYTLRLAAGACMFLASAWWLADGVHSLLPPTNRRSEA